MPRWHDGAAVTGAGAAARGGGWLTANALLRLTLRLAALLLLAACAAPPARRAAIPAPSPLNPYLAGRPSSCVPFARVVSGIDIHGDAWTWWPQAAGHYARGGEPAVGAVLALKRSPSLPLGHVAVVAEVQDRRDIMVTQANWGGNGEIDDRQPVQDISTANDWTEVRFMNRIGTYGRPYAAFGFIYRTPPSNDGRQAAQH